MKIKNTFRIIVLLLSTQIYSQNICELNVEYDMIINFDNTETYNSNLCITKNGAYFEYQRKNDNGSKEEHYSETNEEIKVKIDDNNKYYIKTNTINNNIQDLRKGFDKENSFYIVEEPIPNIKWDIHKETKVIDNYSCLKATTIFRGRNYTAWFTPEIPINYGPYKFHGLKGVILEIYDDTKEVIFMARKISFSKEDMKFNIDKNFKTISNEEYNEKMKQFIDNIERKIVSRGNRNFKIKVGIPKPKTIEIYED